MSAFGFFLALALTGVCGWSVAGILARPEDSGVDRAAHLLAGGFVVLHLGLTALQLAGLSWSVPTLALFGAAAALAGRLLRRPSRARPEPLGWADSISGIAVALFAAAALALWLVFPDFVFHWGIKGERYALRGGIDWPFLAAAWNWRSHPDYPQLLPELFAITARLGRWSERAMMAWSAVHLGLVVLAARAGLEAGGVEGATRRMATALVAALVSGFAIANLLAGSADWLMAAAALLAVASLMRPPEVVEDRRLAFVAALAAMSKIEGVPFAVFLVLSGWARHVVASGKAELRALGRIATLPATVILVWWAQCRHFGLFQPFNTGSLDLSRGPEVLRSLAGVALSPAAGGALLLLGLPFLAARAGSRAVALLLAAQFAFYLYIYLSAPVDPAFSVQSTFARLAFHLWPAATVAAIAAADRLVRNAESWHPSAP